MLKAAPCAATVRSALVTWLPGVTPPALGASTWQVLATFGAGFMPKNSFLQLTLPVTVFCVQFPPLPNCTTVGAGRVKVCPWSPTFVQLPCTFRIFAMEGTPALSMANSM
jgi:hypothetical protein